MDLFFLTSYKEVFFNMKGMNIKKIHPIIRGDYLKIISFCHKNNIGFRLLNEGEGGLYKKRYAKNFFGKIKLFFLENITLFLPTMNKVHGGKKSLMITDNQFLITKSDYIIFLDWVHSFVGYNAKGLYNPILKFIIKFFISRKNLKYLIIATHTGLDGIKNYLGEKFYKKYKKKFIVEYPKLLIDEKYLVKLKQKRKENLKKQTYKSFLFIGKDFVRKGGIETVTTIYNLFKKGKINKYSHKFTFITKKDEIPNFLFKKYEKLVKNKIINHFEPSFKVEEIYEKFYTNHKIFLLPTRGDPFGMVFLEVKAFQMEVITTKQGSVEEIFKGYKKIKFINFIDKKYNWLRSDLRPKWNQVKLMNKNFNLFFKDFKNELF